MFIFISENKLLTPDALFSKNSSKDKADNKNFGLFAKRFKVHENFHKRRDDDSRSVFISEN